MHRWGDDFLYFQEVGQCAKEIGDFLRKWGRVPVRDTKEKYGCYDDATEVLTKDGWKFFKNLTLRDKLATLDIERRIEYQEPSTVIAYNYSGDMHYMCSEQIDLCITPEHRVYTFLNKKWSLVEVRYLEGDKEFLVTAHPQTVTQISLNFVIPEYKSLDFPRPENVVKLDSWLFFLGHYVKEGSALGSAVTLIVPKNNKEILIRHLENLNYKYLINEGIENYHVHVFSYQLADWLIENCKDLANRRVPSFIFDLDSASISLFIDALFGSSDTFKHQSKLLLDDIQILLLYNGESGVIQNPDNAIIRNVKPTYVVLKESSGTVPYTGDVFCVQIPNEIVYVRRMGKPVWCGNSVRVYLSFGWHQLHSITHPSYCYNQYPNWLWKLDVLYFSKIISKLNYIVVPFHVWLYKRAYKKVLKKYPYIRDEILSCADYPELLKGL